MLRHALPPRRWCYISLYTLHLYGFWKCTCTARSVAQIYVCHLSNFSGFGLFAIKIFHRFIAILYLKSLVKCFIINIVYACNTITAYSRHSGENKFKATRVLSDYTLANINIQAAKNVCWKHCAKTWVLLWDMHSSAVTGLAFSRLPSCTLFTIFKTQSIISGGQDVNKLGCRDH